MGKKVELGNFVWGKVDGYPWWPGIVQSFCNQKYEILFFGDFSRAFLKEDKIKDFDEKSMNTHKKKAILQEALN